MPEKQKPPQVEIDALLLALFRKSKAIKSWISEHPHEIDRAGRYESELHLYFRAQEMIKTLSANTRGDEWENLGRIAEDKYNAWIMSMIGRHNAPEKEAPALAEFQHAMTQLSILRYKYSK